MVPWLLVVDDFLKNPDAVRKEALSLTYAVPGRYPGLNSVEKIELEGLEQIISALVHQPVHAPWGPDYSHRSCRLSLASDDKPARIHIDESHWTGVLYLSRPEDCRGGTEFYRHIRTGTDRVPMDMASLNAVGYSTYKEMEEDILNKDAFDRSKWELRVSVPAQFNRLVLVQPHYWHTAGHGFGDSINTGRLVYLMFFKRGAAGPER
jgi:hypothetical protein